MHMVKIQIVPKDTNNEDSLCTHTDTPLNRTTTVRFMYILPKIAYTHKKSKHTYMHVCTYTYMHSTLSKLPSSFNNMPWRDLHDTHIYSFNLYAALH